MDSFDDPGDESFDAASSQLSEGLRTCRAVLYNYRSLIGNETDADQPQRAFSERREGDEPFD